MIIENNELREQLQRVLEEQDSRANNIDTREWGGGIWKLRNY